MSHVLEIIYIEKVCEEEECQDDVFPLAMNILDRFLSIIKIRKGQLQLLGSSCLFLASKFKQAIPLSANKLMFYTDYSITINELLVSSLSIKIYLLIAFRLKAYLVNHDWFLYDWFLYDWFLWNILMRFKFFHLISALGIASFERIEMGFVCNNSKWFFEYLFKKTSQMV